MSIKEELNNSFKTQVSNIGPTGPRGLQGPRGIQGPQGLDGSQGPQGYRGPQGYAGQQGPIGLRGLQGPTGSRGIQGLSGNIGPTGDRGEQGPTGDRGEQGPTGDRGEKGPTGARGEQGPTGPSFSSYAEDSGGCFTYLTFTDVATAPWTSLGITNQWTKLCGSSSLKYIYSGTYNNYSYQSSDFGITWNPTTLPIGITQDCCMSVCGKNRLVSLGGDGFNDIFSSNDFGNTWRRTNLGHGSVCMNASGKIQLFCKSGDYLYISYDFGNTWVKNSNFIGDWKIARMSASGKTIIVSAWTYTGLLKISTDYGSSWTQIEPQLGNFTNLAMSANGQHVTASKYPGKICVSHNYGFDWKETNYDNHWQGFSMCSSGEYQIGIDYSGNGGIWYSNDYGETWDISSTISQQYVTGIISSSGQMLICGSPYGTSQQLYVSNRTIKTSFISHAEDAVGCLTYLTFTDTSTAPCTSLGIIDPVERITKVCGSSSLRFLYAGTYNSYSYQSSNFGNTWSPTTLPIGVVSNSCMSACGKNRLVCINGDGLNDVFSSNDFGNTWSRTNLGQGVICMNASGKIQMFCKNSEYVYISYDFGVNWEKKLNFIGDWKAPRMSATGKNIIVPDSTYQGKLYISSDYGDSWSQVEPNVGGFFNMAMSSNGQHVTGSPGYQGKIYISHDFGFTWKEKNYERAWREFSVCDSGEYQIGVDSNGGILWYSDDYGETWGVITGIPTRQYVTGILSSSGQMIVCGSGLELYFSRRTIW